MNNGYRVVYDSDDQVCIIPNPTIPLDDCAKLFNMYSNLGYKYWLPADQIGGFILSKKETQIKENIIVPHVGVDDQGYICKEDFDKWMSARQKKHFQS